MDLLCDERLSDSPYVERIWYSQSERATPFVSIAQTHWEMVVTKHKGEIILTVRGPETQPTSADCPADAQWLGIQFKAGAFMPNLLPEMLMDRRDVNLPSANSKSFWLNGSAWEFPDYENADTFVDWLVRDGLIVHEPVVQAVMNGQMSGLSLRSVQRRFQRATGLTLGEMGQIDRARYATGLLKQGISILDTVHEAGYSDQPHLTRSLKRFIGQTPAQIIAENTRDVMSFLFKTSPF